MHHVTHILHRNVERPIGNALSLFDGLLFNYNDRLIVSASYWLVSYNNISMSLNQLEPETSSTDIQALLHPTWVRALGFGPKLMKHLSHSTHARVRLFVQSSNACACVRGEPDLGKIILCPGTPSRGVSGPFFTTRCCGIQVKVCGSHHNINLVEKGPGGTKQLLQLRLLKNLGLHWDPNPGQR